MTHEDGEYRPCFQQNLQAFALPEILSLSKLGSAQVFQGVERTKLFFFFLSATSSLRWRNSAVCSGCCKLFRGPGSGNSLLHVHGNFFLSFFFSRGNKNLCQARKVQSTLSLAPGADKTALSIKAA